MSSLPQVSESAPGEAADTSDLDLAFREHAHWLIAFLRRRFGREQAEDLAQETFVRAAGARVELRNPRAFLAKVALNTARDAARRQAVRPILTAEEPKAATPAEQTESLLLKQVILSLPPREREVFLLSRFGGLTYAEIAHRYGISVKTVEARMTRALAMCTARMRD